MGSQNGEPLERHRVKEVWETLAKENSIKHKLIYNLKFFLAIRKKSEMAKKSRKIDTNLLAFRGRSSIQSGTNAKTFCFCLSSATPPISALERTIGTRLDGKLVLSALAMCYSKRWSQLPDRLEASLSFLREVPVAPTH
jgi:hypothetical protein